MNEFYKIFDNFRLHGEKEHYEDVVLNINKGVEFKGTNLWILVFAIFIASLGLNVNSTAVIIGAMLVSPLMGPIMGLGLGMAINDLALLRKAVYNYLFAAGVGLATSTLYFFVSPINDAHSEILARTSPNIYDVLIALFGGLAGILATSSKQKGNVIPGVAIATALMPPLCTAGYGLATWKMNYFFGAFYLFLINTVFIALATFITARVLKFPFATFLDEKAHKKNKRLVGLITIITVLPSLYFGYDIVQKNKFERKANMFVDIEAVFPNDYLLLKKVDPKTRTITLTFGGDIIDESEIKLLKNKLVKYGLEDTKLEIQQGFAYLTESDDKDNQLKTALSEKEKQMQLFAKHIDSLNGQKTLSKQVFKELKIQYPEISSFILQPVLFQSDSSQSNIWISVIQSRPKMEDAKRAIIQKWLSTRIENKNVKVIFETAESTKSK